MVPLPIRSAYTCARCQLRQLALRRPTASRTEGHLRAARHASIQSAFVGRAPEPERSLTTEDSPRRASPFTYRRPLGEIFGKSGRKRRQRSEKLKIKALDKETEVLVIRDLPESRTRVARETVDEPVEEEKGQPLGFTPEELIKSLREDTLPQGGELFKAINEHQPEELVLSRHEFDRAVIDLKNSHTIKQLRQYLRQHSTLQVKSTAAAQETRESSSSGELQNVVSTSWTRGTTRISKPLSLQPTNGTKTRLQSLNHHATAEHIFRTVWKVQIDDETTASGELEMILTSRHWALLQTRDADRLFDVLRSGRFYSNSKLQTDQSRGVLRITGPQSEVEGLAELIKSAFASATHATIDLVMLKPVVMGNHKFASVFTNKRLQDIMQMTRTLCTYDEVKDMLEISGFHQPNVQDAHRLLLTMLQYATSINQRCVQAPLADHVMQMPTTRPESLPSHQRFGQYTRARIVSLDKDGMGPAMDGHALQRSVTDAMAQSSIAGEDEPMVEDATRSPGVWQHPQFPLTWTATFGLALRPISSSDSLLGPKGEKTPVSLRQSKANKKVKSTQKSTPAVNTQLLQPFAPQVPSLTSILSNFRKAPSQLDVNSTSGSYLVANLIPSPFSVDYEGRNIPINVTFKLTRGQRAMQPLAGTSEDADSQSESPKFAIDNNTVLELLSIEASLQQNFVDVLLPHAASDIRFTRSYKAQGSIKQLLGSTSFTDFVHGIVQSMRAGAALRAPPLVLLPAPPSHPSPSNSDSKKSTKTTSRKSSKRKKAQKNESPAQESDRAFSAGEQNVEYFFTGFEHRETRLITPRIGKMDSSIVSGTDQWLISDVEGGFSGGKRLEFSVTTTAAESETSEQAGFVSRVLAMAAHIDKTHRGEVEAYRKIRTKGPSTAEQEQMAQ